MMFGGHVICLVALLVVLVACPVTSQIHFSPTWGTGKRSEQPEPALPFTHPSASSCWADSDLRIVFQVAQMIKREAVRYAQCLQADSTLAAFKDE